MFRHPAQVPSHPAGIREPTSRGTAALDAQPSARHREPVLTGERTVPGIPHENYWFRRHEAAYEYALPFVTGRRVLEVGSGEGYGTALLAGAAAQVVGLDYDAATVAHAAHTYRPVPFVRANLAALPLTDAAVDIVVGLQVIEHLWDHAQFLEECRRVLHPHGRLLVTTPNRLTFSPGLDSPVNPFHTKEFTANELTELLQRTGFEPLALAGLHAGPRIAELDRRYRGFAAAQLAEPPDRWPAGLLADVVAVTTADFPVVPAADGRIDDALDLVALARRR